MSFKLFLVLTAVLEMDLVTANDGIFQRDGNGRKLYDGFFTPTSIDPSVSDMYQNITTRHTGAPKYAAFTVQPDRGVVTDDAMTGDPVETTTKEEDRKYFNRMRGLLTDSEPRFILYHFGFKGKDGTDVRAVALIVWISDKADQSTRTLYLAMLNAIREALLVPVEVVAYNLGTIDYNAIAEKADKSSE